MDKDSLYITLGAKIRAFRKARNITLAQMSKALNKSISTISKYETGEIAIDIELLIDLCRYLDIDIHNLLPDTRTSGRNLPAERYMNHFVERFYIYWFKGGENKIHISAIENDNSTLCSTFYFDVRDIRNIYESDYVYTGTLSYSDTSIDYVFHNAVPPYDMLTLSIPTVSKEQTYRISLLTSITFYYQRVAIKCLASQTPVTNMDFLIKKLQISQEDIKLLKSTNFFTI